MPLVSETCDRCDYRLLARDDGSVVCPRCGDLARPAEAV